MAGTQISEATSTTPLATDLVPIARPNDTTARQMTVAALTVLAQEGNFLTADADAAATTFTSNAVPKGSIANSVWAVIDPYTNDCEIRKVTAFSGKTCTVGALTYNHAEDDAVFFVTEPVANVKWFGALGDGSTDDVTAFDNAISEISNIGGGTVVIPAETFCVKSTITLDDDVSLIGLGPASEVYTDLTSDTKGVRAFQKSNVTLQNFRVYSPSGEEFRLIEISDSEDIIIDQLECERSGALDTGCSIMIMDSSSRVKITNCRIDDINLAILLQCETAAYGWGNDVLISGCTITGKEPTPNGNELIKVDRGYEEVRIVNNHISGEIIYSAITVEEGAREVIIANNQIIFQDSPTTWAASTDYSLDDIVVPTTVGSRYYKCTVAGTSDGSEPSPWTTTVGNTQADNTVTWECRNFMWYGVRLTTGQAVGLDDIDYVLNVCIQNNQIMGGRYGIWSGSKGSATDLLIAGNYIKGQYTDAIFGYGSGVDILNNIIIDNGLYFLASDYVNIIGNIIEDPGAIAINAENFTTLQDNWVIANNIITGFTTSGLEIRYVDGLVIKDNVFRTDSTLVVTSGQFPVHLWDSNTTDVHVHGNYFHTPNAEVCIRANAISGTLAGYDNHGLFTTSMYSLASVTLKSNDYNEVTFGSAAPASGTWVAGDICYDTSPTAESTIGWVCVTGGSPGTWKAFGTIAA